MTTARRLHYTYQQYLAALEVSGVKLEYCDGEIYAMAGDTPAHADLAASATRLLGNALLARCRVSSSDLKVRIEATDLSTFPDVTVVCGERETAAADRNAVINPTLLVEVTSDSAEDYDRGEKLNHYKQCPSVQAVLFVSHRRPQLTLVRRTSTGWAESEHRAGERVELENPSSRWTSASCTTGFSWTWNQASRSDRRWAIRRSTTSSARRSPASSPCARPGRRFGLSYPPGGRFERLVSAPPALRLTASGHPS